MLKYVTKRLTIAIFTLLLIIFILFAILQYMPGTPFNDEKLTSSQIEQLNEKYGLDKPITVKFENYVFNILKGDFGDSYVIQKNMPISDMLVNRLSISVRMGLVSILIGIIVGLLLGVVAAVCHSTILDPIISFISMLGASIPSYVFGLLLMYFIAYKLKAFPVLYSSTESFTSIILPSIALSMFPIASIARFSRNEMVEVMNAEYITLAESKGIEKWEVILKHALRNAMIPILTVIAPMIVGLMLGSTVIESIFSIPGIGNLFVMAIQVNDYNVVISIAFIYSALYIVIMLIVDLLYGVIDPRIRFVKGEVE
ncbi:ABC transporter permease [Clostridium sp. YIM B02555]|uniref:ABC transporter permease n=1 Tax=Clostridium sp. YIM B02555 TaxID=2911968 RepID=UPI001EEED06B|nr:ABC transporter permease [Clostridium sp. YIM B02555]